MYGKRVETEPLHSKGVDLDKMISQWNEGAHLHNNCGNCMDLLSCSTVQKKVLLCIMMRQFQVWFVIISSNRLKRICEPISWRYILSPIIVYNIKKNGSIYSNECSCLVTGLNAFFSSFIVITEIWLSVSKRNSQTTSKNKVQAIIF